MKKILLLLLIVLLCPLEVFAKEDLEISSTIVDENFQVIEKTPTRIDNNDIYLDLTFNRVQSYITYQLNINNNTDDSYVVENDSIKSSSDYIDYSIQCESSNKIKPHTNGVCYLRVTYNNSVPTALLNNQSFIENRNIDITFSNGDLINPNTGSKIIIVLIMFILLLVITIKWKKKYALTLFLLLLLIPTLVKADKKIVFIVHSNIEITGNGRKCSHNPRDFEEYVKCVIETDFYDIHKEELEKRLEDPSTSAVLLPDDIEEAKAFMKAYDYFIDHMVWNYEEKNDLTKNNFQNYADGMYFRGRLIAPFYHNDTYTVGESQRVTFANPKTTDVIENIQFPNIDIEFTSENSMDIDIPVTASFAIFDNNQEIDYYDINIDMLSSISKETDAETGDSRLIMSEWPTNPESVSQCILNCQSSLINSLMDFYINYKRTWFFPPDSNIEYRDYIYDYLYDINSNSYYNELKRKELLYYLDKDIDDLLASGDMEYFDPNHFTYVYNGKFYEGENCIFYLIADLYHIDISNSKDIKETVVSYIWDMGVNP